jgi:hypothetical protein
VARSHPDGVFLGGALQVGSAAPVVRALRAEIPGVRLLAPDGFALFPDVTDLVGPAAEGMFVSQAGIAAALLRGAGQRFVAEFGKQIGGAFYPYTAYAAQATELRTPTALARP